VAPALELWTRDLGLTYEISFAPYNQVFQSLLDSAGGFASNRNGINVVLVRWQDFADGGKLREKLDRFCRAIQSAALFGAPILIISCPCSPGWTSGEEHGSADLFDQLVSERLTGAGSITFLGRAYQERLYSVAEPHDPRSERLGWMPYTAEFYAALATMIARFTYGVRTPPSKVIVMDCDNTLWRGVIGDDGPLGVQLDEGSRYLQEFVIARQREGMLLALCSKNNESDVLETFKLRSDFPLRMEDVVAHKINWQPKSINLRGLARELNLGIDSFIFIDDDRKECAEIESNCPEVLTLRLPTDQREFQHFLEHVWAFDHWTSTADDKNRTAVYGEKLLRERLQREAESLEDFIQSLDLRVNISLMRDDQLGRVSQLTHRTNQFNCATVRRTEAEVLDLLRNGFECLTIDVADRFGSYGLVGALLFRPTSAALEVETFILSCRALGRGVEHRILAHLGTLAATQALPRVDIAFRPTAKNAPARNFLTSLEGGTACQKGELTFFQFPAEYARTVEYHPAEDIQTFPEEAKAVEKPAPARYLRNANSWNTPAELLRRIQVRRGTLGVPETASAGPRTPLESTLVTLWSGVLGHPVGIHDNYFDMGGDSLTAVRLLSETMREFAIEDLTMNVLIDAPTIAQFACMLVRGGSREYHTIIQMRSGADRPPFYIMHGGGGNILSLRELAQALPSDLPVYCLQARGLDGSPPFESVEEMAACYVDEIRKVQPEGPYYFGGHCYGGLVAFEMARVFRAQCKAVGLVALIDTYNFAYGDTIPKSRMLYCNARFIAKRGVRSLLRFASLSPNKWAEYARGRLALTRKYIGGLAAVVTGRKRSQIMSGPLIGVPQAGTTEFEDILKRVADCNVRNQEKYVPQPYDGAVTVIRAERRLSEPYEESALGWTPLVRGGVDVKVAPGDHSEMTTAPLVHDLACILDGCLRNADWAKRSRIR
jgi:FkbH-like protein